MILLKFNTVSASLRKSRKAKIYLPSDAEVIKKEFLINQIPEPQKWKNSAFTIVTCDRVN